MSAPDPISIACPTCGETAGRYCVFQSLADGGISMRSVCIDGVWQTCPARIAAANPPRTAEAKRWIAFADALDAEAEDFYEKYGNPQAQTALRHIAAIARRVAEEDL